MGKFIIVEGIDCSGKSTLIDNYIENNPTLKIFKTKEFSDNEIGRYIKEELISGKQHILDYNLIDYLAIADRIIHYTCDNGIMDNLRCNDIVICDRGYLSNIVYHCLSYYGTHTFEEEANIFIKYNMDMMKYLCYPDLTIFLDTPPSVANCRAIDRDHKDIYENEESLVEVSNIYKEVIPIIEHMGLAIEVISGDQSQEDVLRDMQVAVSEVL